MVSPQLLQELKEIIKSEYGVSLDMQEISEIGNGLVGYYDLLAKMNHQNNENEISIVKNQK